MAGPGAYVQNMAYWRGAASETVVLLGPLGRIVLAAALWERLSGTMQRGTLAALAMIGLAAALGSLGLWLRYRAGDAALEFWTPEAAALLGGAPHAELWRLEPAVEAKTVGDLCISQDGRTWCGTRLVDLAATGGFSHARGALLEDASFDWRRSAATGPAHWQYALRFLDGPRQAVVLIDLEAAEVALAGRQRRASIGPLAPKLRIFLDDVVRQAQAGLVTNDEAAPQ